MKKLIVGISAEGSVVLLKGQLRYFKEIGYDTYLLGPTSNRVKEYCTNEGCIHININIKRDIAPIRDFFILLKLIRLFIIYKPDIINLGTPKISLLGMIAAKIARVKKRIYTCRGFRFEPEKGLKRRLLILTERVTALFAHKIICISPSLQELGIRNKIFTISNSSVINKGSSNGIDLKKFSPKNIDLNQRNQLIHKLGLNDYFVFGFVGRIYDRKGINELYHAFSALSENMPDLRLLLVGRFEEDQISDKGIIELIKIHKGVIYAGPQNNIPLFLSLMDVFVFPVWGEGFGNVAIEAAAMGIPVISTDSTGAKDAVKHNFNGLMVEPKSFKKLKDIMLFFYENKGIRETMGRNGIEWAKNFDNLIIWNGMEQIYNSIN